MLFQISCIFPHQALQMIGNIRDAFNELLTDVEWMDDETREVAREKVSLTLEVLRDYVGSRRLFWMTSSRSKCIIKWPSWDDIFKSIFWNEPVWIPIKTVLKFLPRVPIDNELVLAQMMVLDRKAHRPLSEPVMMPYLPMHMWVSQPQWTRLWISDY